MVSCLIPPALLLVLCAFFMFSHVSLPECGGGPTPLPAPVEMNDIPMVISITALALRRLIRGEKLGHLEAAVIDDVLRSMWPANHSSIRPILSMIISGLLLCGWKKRLSQCNSLIRMWLFSCLDLQQVKTVPTGITCPMADRADEGMKHTYLYSHSFSVYFLLLCSVRFSLISLCCLFKNMKDTQPVSIWYVCKHVCFLPVLSGGQRLTHSLFAPFKLFSFLLHKSCQSFLLSLILLTVSKGPEKICCAVLVLSASGLPVGGM